MPIDPKQPFARFELERVKLFLGQIDLSVDEEAGKLVQEAYEQVRRLIERLEQL